MAVGEAVCVRLYMSVCRGGCVCVLLCVTEAERGAVGPAWMSLHASSPELFALPAPALL